MYKPRKIISGSFTYVAKVSRQYYILGWRIVKQNRWSDGKWTLVMEMTDD